MTVMLVTDSDTDSECDEGRLLTGDVGKVNFAR